MALKNMNNKNLLLLILTLSTLTVAFVPDLLAKVGRMIPGFDVIYPVPDNNLKFKHEKHQTLSCETCHTEILQSQKTADRNLPEESNCKKCHGDKIRVSVNESGTEAKCGFCHNDYDPLNKSRPSRVFWPQARIEFSHAKHIKNGLKCDKCHLSMSSNKNRHLPKEKLCLECHNHLKINNKCAKCHESLPSGQLRTDFDGVYLVPLDGKLDHQRDWDKRHVAEAKFDEAACKTCHQQNFCNKCHDGIMKPMKIHPEDYATMHPIDARRNSESCNSCHRFQSFCMDCHQKMGLTQKAERQNSRTQIHPDGFASCNRTVTHHSDQAKRSLLACVSCHTESDCIQCHGAKGIQKCGKPIKIHGHLSYDKLSRMKAKNPRACKKCHEF